MTNKSFSIEAVIHEDVPVLAKIWSDSFEVDRHTEMKNQGKVPYDMEELGKSAIPRYIDSETVVVIKAVDDDTGDNMGWVAWGFRGFEKDEIPVVARAPLQEDHLGDKQWKVEKGSEEKKEPATERTKNEPEQPDEKNDSIKKLEALTDQDMKEWMEKLMPPGTRCMFVITLSVAPAYQKRGVGSALLKWGTDTADKSHAFIWVHSSEGAWGGYAKSGFEIIGTLDLDLDEYAVSPPNDGTDKWGHYVFRYMKYLPKKA